ncbi:hypothetical protein B0H14DRAFT_2564532 [Mycena olivaceomarginata]|nr:hypothetical protein B0H14DRAFT_2564532 [Mycena olivaceomarginata]
MYTTTRPSSLESSSVSYHRHSWNSDFHLPMAQLKAYRATYFDASTLFRDLSAAVNLVDADIQIWSKRFDGLLAFPNLRRLSVTIDHLLDHIIAPGLQDPRIHGDIDHILFPFLHKSASASRRLTLFQCIEKDTNVIRLLHGIPSSPLSRLTSHPNQSPQTEH